MAWDTASYTLPYLCRKTDTYANSHQALAVEGNSRLNLTKLTKQQQRLQQALSHCVNLEIARVKKKKKSFGLKTDSNMHRVEQKLEVNTEGCRRKEKKKRRKEGNDSIVRTLFELQGTDADVKTTATTKKRFLQSYCAMPIR